MATTEQVKAQLQSLIDQANETTGGADADLTSAFNTLSAGYGQGGGSSDSESNIVAWVTFMSEDGTTEYGKRAVIKGDDCPNPVSEGLFNEPTKESTEANTFSFSGWSTSIGGSVESSPFADIKEDKTLYAVFESAVRYYTVKFYDGETLLNTEQVAYGGSSSYVYNKTNHKFNGWTPEPTNITGDTDCVGSWVFYDGYITDDWDVIAQSVAEGTHTSKYSIGEKMKLSVADSMGTTQTLDMVIVAFNHDDLSDGSGKAGITFMSSKSLLMFAPDGSTRAGYAWDKSTASNYTAKKWLNEIVLPTLPEKLQSSIKEVTKVSQYNWNSKTVNGVDYYEPKTSSSGVKLWIPSITELGFSSSDDSEIIDEQGEWYSEAFPDANSKIRIAIRTNTVLSHITRSRKNADNTFYGISNTGAITDITNISNNSQANAILCFCI